MTFQEKIAKIEEKIRNKDYETAEQDLLQIINDEEIKSVEDEQNTYYTFYNYVETIIFYNKYKPIKKLMQPNNNIADVYFLLGFINFEIKNFGKALDYLNKASEWNPVSPQIILAKAAVYRVMGEIERFRVEVERSYQYIYTSSFMSKYYRELGWYYSEKRLFNVANALYSRSKAFLDTELANKELMYIAQQEKREPRISTIDEIKKIFTEYNIPLGISNNVTQMIYDNSQMLMKDNKNPQLVNYLYRILYDITLDKRFMLYVNLKDDKTGITIKFPEIWRIVNKESYSKFGISENTLFLFLTQTNENISVVCDGRCEPNQLDVAYNMNIENIKKKGLSIEAEYYIKGQKTIKQAFVLGKVNDKTIRIFQNYLVVNGYLINISWEVPSDVPLEKIIEVENDSLKGQLVWAITGDKDDNSTQEVMNEINSRLNEQLSQGKTMQEAMGIVFGDNPILREIKEEYNANGITPKVVESLNKLAIQIIKDHEIDLFWSDTSRNVFKLLILSNIMNNKDFVLPDLVSQTENVELVRNILISNLEKLEVSELQDVMIVKPTINSDKPFKSVVEIIHEGVLPYKRTELQQKGKEELENKKEEKNKTPTKEEKIETEIPKSKSNAIIIKCPVCNNEFKLNWNVPASEKTFYCKCPNCNAEIKKENPNYKG